MGVYKLSGNAEIDLDEMYEYGIVKFGLLQAQNYFFEMEELFKLLSQNAELGRDASEFIPQLKRFSFKAHTIFSCQQITEYLLLVF
ncbi:MAG: type II toxin-antitoxin system RelE/ParE family toxin [Flavobacteriaceae bacterium]|nr:type II toxin-antitoxin system RelE/ParE family toxin [Flavobacteriaceae bacterium]